MDIDYTEAEDMVKTDGSYTILGSFLVANSNSCSTRVRGTACLERTDIIQFKATTSGNEIESFRWLLCSRNYLFCSANEYYAQGKCKAT